MDSLEELADERDRLRTEEREILAEIGKTRSRLEKLRGELQTLRRTRDELNETVKALKKTRDEHRELAKRSMASLREIYRVPRRVTEASRAEKELAQLEWKVQTDPLEKEEEKRLMARIQVLESKVGFHRKSQRLSEDITKRRREADELHVKIQALASESQTHHSEIVRLGDEVQGLRSKLEEENKALDDVRVRIAEVDRKYTHLRNAARQVERVSQAKKEKAYREGLKDAAKKKLSQGGKVSLEELGALYGEDEE